MDLLETLAITMVVLTALEIFLLFLSPEKYRKLLVGFLTFPWISGIVMLAVSAFALRFLLLSGLGVIEIFAVIFFAFSLLAFGACSFAGELRVFVQKIFDDEQARRKALPVALAWGALAAWVLVALVA